MIETRVARRFNVRIPLRDGVTLSADLALPEALPAPAVVVRTPYGKTGERNSQRAAMFAKAGYACALVDVRGRGDSDGEFQPYRNDGPDGAEVIAWAGAQDWFTCVRLPAGHRLRVEIASSAFPKFDVNLGTGGDMITETEGVIATNRLWHTPSRPSRLILN